MINEIMRTKVSLGIDIGGTNIAYGVIDREGECVLIDSKPIKSFDTPQALIAALRQDIERRLDTRKFQLIGVGTGAPSGNYFAGTIENTANLNWEGRVPFVELTEKEFGLPAFITNDAKVSMGVKPEDVDSCFMGCNGVVYLTNKVFAPAAYRSVSFPALVRRNTTMGVVYWAIEQLGLDAYLNSMDTRYSLVLPTNDAFLQYIDPVSYGEGTSTLYQFFWDEERQNVRADKYQYDMATGQILDPEHYESAYANAASGKDNDPIMNRLSDIMENAIVVGDIEDGHTYYKTKGGSILKVTRGGQNGVMISGGLQVEQNNPVEVTTIYDQTESGNGKAYVIEDRLLMPSRKSVYTTLSEHPEYARFLELLSGGDPDSTEYSLLTALIDEKYECVDQNITLFDTYNYTVYVPTNEAIEKLHEEGILPYWTDFDAATDEGLRYKIKNRIVNFLRYHIQDNSVFIGDNTESGLKYETGMLNPANRRFYSIEVNKIGTDGMELTDQLGNKRKVVTTEGLYNNVCREYAFNTGANTIYTSSSAVVHQIDGALFYEKSQLEKIEY